MPRIKITQHTAPRRPYTMAARRSAPGTGGMKLKRKSKPGKKALREIKKWQATEMLLIRRLPFELLVKEVGNECKTDLKWSRFATMALQEAVEAVVVELLELANLLAIHAGRVTILLKDLKLARKIMKI